MRANFTPALNGWFSKKIITGFFLLLSFTSINLPCYSQGHPPTDDEFVGPFSSWINVKTQYGAKGDGLADETAALQAAFDAIGNSSSTASVVYLPAGTYRITRTLIMNNKMGVSIIGADPATTTIVWHGADGGIMFQMHGVAYSRFNRITWEGKNTTSVNIASVGIDQALEFYGQDYFDTGNEYADNVFKDMGIGIRGGHLREGFAEIAIVRCKFINNFTAGITLGGFNALDVWIWNSVFENCAVGITNANTSGSAGNFKVYNSVFRNSTNSDIIIGNTGEFSFRDNTSTNSKMFLKAEAKVYPSNITLQSNKILDPIFNKAIDIQNQGPVVLLDNIIRSRAGATSPIVSHTSFPTSDFFSMGNTFTVANAIQSTGRNIIYDNPIVSAGSLSGLREPILPGTQSNLNRTVFEVPLGSDATAIQIIINQAALLTGTRPVVHFSHGTYSIQSTLNIPTGSDMQIVGDGEGDVYPTMLLWTGGSIGPVININGPSKVTLRDFAIHGNHLATNISISNIDQIGSRIFMHQTEVHQNQNNLLVNGLDNSLILAHNSRFSLSSGKSVSLVGGPFASSGNPKAGRTIIYGGLAFSNTLSHEVVNGANLMLRDCWYESSQSGPYLNVSGAGTITIEGTHISAPRSSALSDINLTNFSGKFTLLNTFLWDTVSIEGNGSKTSFLGLGVQFGDNTLPVQLATTSYIKNITSPPGDIRSFNARANNKVDATTNPRSGSYQVNNIGTIDTTYLASMLESARDIHAQVLTPLPAGVTDIRFYRVFVHKSVNGIVFQGLVPFHFRTKQTGNWNDVNTWESSADNSVWTAASSTPDYHANSITISNTHTVTVTENTTIDETIVKPTGAIIVTGSTLMVTNIFPNNGLTLQSNSLGTARIGTSTGNISGNVTVERYNTIRRAWRLLGIPYSSSNKTIRETWMEGGITIAGFGTQITTLTGDPNVANFDAVLPASSIRIYANNTFNSDLVHTPNTTNFITFSPGYFLFVRGDRAIDRTIAGAPTTSTVLRTAGVLNQGSLSAGVLGSSYSLIPNPYPSSIDFDAIKAIAGNTNITTYYVWDASIGTTGNYRTITVSGNAPPYTYTSTPSAGTPDGNPNWRFIESGSAFMVAGSRAVEFTESVKSAGVPPSSMLRVASSTGIETQLVVNLYTVNANNIAHLADGVREIFDKSFDATVNTDDAKKVFGFDLSLGIVSNINTLSVEKRPFPKKDDVINLKLWNNIPGNYRFEVLPANFSAVLTPYLKDNFLNTQTEINRTGRTIVNFTINADTASKAADRFSIVFGKTLPVTGKPVIGKPSIAVYPNPVSNGIVTLRFDNNMPDGIYNIHLINGTGQKIVSRQINHTGENNIQTMKVGNNKGAYLLEIIKPDKSKETYKIIIN